jgi:hypothetical protein
VTVDELVTYVFGDPPTALATGCAGWMSASRRFRGFVETNRDKLRKKVRAARDEAALLDLEAEVATAFRLVQERRFGVTWEPLATAGGRSPDFAVDFTTRLRFYVEVTRPRLGFAGAGQPGAQQGSAAVRLASAVCVKLDQLQPGAINVLVLAGRGVLTADVAKAMHDLKRRAAQREEDFFTRRGFPSVRAFVATSHRLSAILPADEDLWLNPEASRPLPSAVRTALRG